MDNYKGYTKLMKQASFFAETMIAEAKEILSYQDFVGSYEFVGDSAAYLCQYFMIISNHTNAKIYDVVNQRLRRSNYLHNNPIVRIRLAKMISERFSKAISFFDFPRFILNTEIMDDNLAKFYQEDFEVVIHAVKNSIRPTPLEGYLSFIGGGFEECEPMLAFSFSFREKEQLVEIISEWQRQTQEIESKSGLKFKKATLQESVPAKVYEMGQQGV
jgi:hypothetical protein